MTSGLLANRSGYNTRTLLACHANGMTHDSPGLHELLDSWLIRLRAERKSPSTIKAYRAAVEHYLRWGNQHLDKPTVLAWLASMAENEPATARLRLAAVKRFAAWLAAEDYLNADAILLIRSPKLSDKAIPGLSGDEIQRLLKACNGRDWRAKRDKAMVVLLTETGMRASELLALETDDIDLAGCSLVVHKSKSGRARSVRFSPSAAAAIDRYRRGIPGLSGPLWLGTRGRLQYPGLRHSLGARARQAGVAGFHIHRLRHTAAIRWLDAGGTETGLMAQAGWQSREMIDRYSRASRETLAAKEFDRLGLQVDLD